jgi:reverse gyrase
MASINQLKIEKTYQIKVVGKPNTWCKIVGKTDKRVYVYLYEGNAFVKGENGEP